MAPLRYVCILIPRTCECYMAKTLQDVIKLWILVGGGVQRDSLGPSRCALNGITSVFIRGNQREIRHTQKRRQCDHWGRERSDVTISQGTLAASRFWKRQITDSHFQRECGPSDTLICAQGYWFRTSGHQNCEQIHFCCFKSPNMWQFVTAAIGN